MLVDAAAACLGKGGVSAGPAILPGGAAGAEGADVIEGGCRTDPDLLFIAGVR